MERVGGDDKPRLRRVRIPRRPMGPMPGESELTPNQSDMALIVAARDLGIPAQRILEGIGRREIQLAEKPLQTNEKS